ncbi:hypothetical protein [Lentzea albida]|uniref:Uncharacterized protein n=1 Tax=Lentzea albida TaxID=65499 RepID=A0A1H9UB95_9PSEU|nr:hypothetical protein [Lentzea albida]SES06629.1 hypothetical protein SAMN04488000_115150 [Lentzea albida]
MNTIPFPTPSWWKNFPPAWMKEDVKEVFRYVAPGQAYAREANDACFFVWVYFGDGRPAESVGDDVDSATQVLIERGYLAEAERITLTRDCGEPFPAHRLVFTPAGSQLHEQLSKED